MELFHPGVISISCDDCKVHKYDLKTGKVETFTSGPKREEKPKKRPPEIPAPCDKCPKGGPENEEACRLSARNRQAVFLYREVRAGCPVENGDEQFRFNMALIDTIYREWERKRLAEGLAEAIVPLLPWMKRG
jgi:hypothetical protein